MVAWRGRGRGGEVGARGGRLGGVRGVGGVGPLVGTRGGQNPSRFFLAVLGRGLTERKGCVCVMLFCLRAMLLKWV